MKPNVIIVCISIVIIVVLALTQRPGVPDHIIVDMERVTDLADECYENVVAGPQSVEEMLPCREMMERFKDLSGEVEMLPDYLKEDQDAINALNDMTFSVKRAALAVKLSNVYQ